MFNKRLVMMGKISLNKECCQPISNRGYRNKPRGGVWCCPLREDGPYISAWQEFCCRNKPEWLDESFIELTLKEEARVCVINCLDDLEQLYKKYPLIDPLVTMFSLFTPLNYEKIAKDYDVIYLTEQGERETRYSIPLNMNGWDLESVLILDYDIIDNWEHFTVPMLKEA